MSQKFPGGISQEIEEHFLWFAARFGIQGMKHPKKIPNTRGALSMAEFAREQGKLDTFRSLTMEAYWEKDKDIEDSVVLRDLAVASGLDSNKAILAADDTAYLCRVDALRLEANQMHINGIPTFVFETERIVGCQPYEMIAAAARRSGAQIR